MVEAGGESGGRGLEASAAALLIVFSLIFAGLNSPDNFGFYGLRQIPLAFCGSPGADFFIKRLPLGAESVGGSGREKVFCSLPSTQAGISPEQMIWSAVLYYNSQHH